MKTFRYISHTAALAFFLMGGLMITSCQDDNEFEQQNASGLRLSPQLFGMFDKQTRAVDEDEITQLISELRENYMGKKLEVYVVGTGTNNASFFNRYIFEESSQITSQYYLMEGNWRQVRTTTGTVVNQQYVVGDQYRLYALVNRNSDDEIASLDDLKNATVGIVDDTHGIHRWYDAAKTSAPWPDSDNGRDGWELDKTFAMDGYVDFTFSANDADKQLDVNLKRACAKIVLDLKVDPEFLKKIKEPVSEGSETMVINTGTPWVRPVSFNYHAYAADGFADRDPLEPLWYNANLYVIDGRGTVVTDPTEIENPVRQYRLNTYCYPFSWADDELEHTPTLIVSMGLKSGNHIYYYTIPITQKDVKELKRNHVYHIDATITGFGALKVDDVLEEVINLHYDVMEWTVLDSEISLVDVEGDMDFLMVDPNEQSMYGEDADPALVTFYAPDNSLVRYDKDSVYYYNANNVKIYNGNNNNSTTNKTYWSGATITKQGNHYVVSSEVLENHAVKVIKFRVYFDANNNGHYDTGEKYEWVIVKHFPLDFFQNDQGLWSSRTTYGWWNYNTNGTGNYPGGTKYDDLFPVKYFSNNRIYYWNNYYGWTYSSNLNNRNKYIIQITETSSDYALGRVILDNNSQSQNHVVSPAFMIASQLGATSNTTPSNNQIQTYARNAATHCQTYKEVDADGKEWTGWRLPTREEVGVILQYQHAGYDTMSPVMTGRYYWTLEGAAVATGINNEDNQTWYTNWDERWKDTSYDYQSGRGNCYIRCIRDLTPAEVAAVNAKIGHEND